MESETIRLLTAAFSRHVPAILRHKRRAAVALLVRYNPKSQNISDATPPHLHPSIPALLKDLEILYLKRGSTTITPSGRFHRWAGHVAFPGGRQESGETDEETAIRETLEEVGIDLRSTTSPFLRLGRLSDRVVARRNFATAVFVYMQISKDTPPLKLQASEVAGIRWVPLSVLCRENVVQRGTSVPLTFPPLVKPLAKLLGMERVYFPSIMIPNDVDEYGQLEFNLWGFTLRATQEFAEILSRTNIPDFARFSEPVVVGTPASFDGRIANFVSRLLFTGYFEGKAMKIFIILLAGLALSYICKKFFVR